MDAAAAAPPAAESSSAASAATNTRSDSSDLGNDMDNNPMSRILKRGDLVRVLERREAGSRDREGGLGRVHRSIPTVDGRPGPHPFQYDVDWVLGGRIFNVNRWELVHTTADAEGLTEGSTSMRARRKRKPSAALLESQKASEDAEKDARKGKKKVGNNPNKGGKKGAKGTSSAPTKRGKKSVRASEKVGSGTAAKTRRGSDKDSEGTEPDEGEADSEPSRASNALDMYERHKREFEKLLLRLERIDRFDFFRGQPPLELDDRYSDEEDEGRIGDVAQTRKEQNAMEARGDDGGSLHSQLLKGHPAAAKENVMRSEKSHIPDSDSPSDDAKDEKKGETKRDRPVRFPSHPPFNFIVIRKRMQLGRYVLDRRKVAIEERRLLVASYREWKECLDVPVLERGDSEAPLVLHPKGVNWDLFRKDVISMCDAAIARDPRGTTGGSGTLGHAGKKIKEAMEQIYLRTGRRQMAEMSKSDIAHRFTTLLKSSKNKEAAMQVKWRKQAFPERKYERLTSSNMVCAGLSPLDQRSAIFELQTSLPDSFVGLSYTYDDMGQSEGWMKSIVGETEAVASRRIAETKKSKNVEPDEERRTALALASDDGVVKAQVQATMNHLLIAVQDRVMTEMGVLNHPEIRSANWEDGILSPSQPPEVAEQPVWGIDCYTRRNIEMCLEQDFGSLIAIEFIEKWLIPAINSCPVGIASNIVCATRILEGLPPSEDQTEADMKAAHAFATPNGVTVTGTGSHVLLSNALAEKIKSSAPPWLKAVAHQLRIAAEALACESFRIHPKGHGSVVLRPDGIPANTLVTYYRGEVYPPWRWGEKMDAIEKTQRQLHLRPILPDFYNMALERPQVDPRGYGLLFVDASRKAGLGSSFSHSCEPTCEVRVAAVGGQLSLAMTTVRDLERGEELTFDYNAVTESLNEYQSAICLCGHAKCRGSFLHFATADCYQQVLSRNLPLAVRFASLAKGCRKKIMSREDAKVLETHGFGTAAFGAVSFNHHRAISESCEGRTASNERLDSLENVPIWLRTFVADTLRYIEYERRALPVALVCDHFCKQKDSAQAEKANGCKPPSKTATTRKNTAKKASVSKKGKKAKLLKDSVDHSKEEGTANVEVPQTKAGVDGAEIQHGVASAQIGKQIDDRAKSSTTNVSTKAIADSDKTTQNWSVVEHAENTNSVDSQTKDRVKPGALRDGDKPIPGAKPENVFLFFSKKLKNYFVSVLHEQGLTHLKGLELNRAVQKVAGCTWKALSDEMKLHWKDRALVEWEMNGGREKAKLEEERKKQFRGKIMSMRQEKTENDSQAKGFGSAHTAKQDKLPRKRKHDEISLAKIKKEEKKVSKGNTSREVQSTLCDASFSTSKISFEAADAEGWSAMEQRIQQLTQALSRVGRVLDRQRESSFENQSSLHRSSASSTYLHPPLSIMSDGQVVHWIWNHDEGVVQTLLRWTRGEPFAGSALQKSLCAAVAKYDELKSFTRGSNRGLCPAKGRQSVSAALLDIRSCIVTEVQAIENEVRHHQQERARQKARARREAARKKREELKAAAIEGLDMSKDSHTFAGGDSPTRISSRALDDPVSPPATGQEKVHVEEGTLPTNCDRIDSSDGSESSTKKLQPLTAPLPNRRDGEENNFFPSETVPISHPVAFVCSGPVHNCEKELSKNHTEMQKVTEKEPIQVENVQSTKVSEQYNQRYKLEAAADLLLMYAHTNTFFILNPYITFESTPIEVYARELGNAVPRSAIDVALAKERDDSSKDVLVQKLEPTAPLEPACFVDVTDNENETETSLEPNKSRASEATAIASEVVVGEAETKLTEDAFVLGNRLDVLRQGKEKYCEGIVVDVDVKRVKFHFPKMLTKFDEWVEMGSSRIARLNSYTVAKKKSQAKQNRGSDKSSAKSKRDSKDGGTVKNQIDCAAIASQGEGINNFCEPDDVITKVVVRYQGDYVLSQLLQWYNGGIGQKPGLPNMLGCISLPPMAGCLTEPNVGKVAKLVSKNTRDSEYSSKIRLEIAAWFQDRYKRGNPWPDTISDYFSCESANVSPAGCELFPFGSPVLDLLVTGDDANIQFVLQSLRNGIKNSDAVGSELLDGKSAAERLKSTMDEGLPAQAVANWVQCENPSCMKWRKVPWHVDVDLLPDQFFCKDNIWNPDSNSCSAPEDAWDAFDAPVGYNDTGVASAAEELPPVDMFALGARFDVLRTGKNKYTEATVVDRDFHDVKQVKFHFLNKHTKYDEWVEVGSSRIAPHLSHSKNKSSKTKRTEKLPEDAFTLGSRFDVLRQGKKEYSEGIVVDIDLHSDVKRAKFHFPKKPAQCDEWVKLSSSRIARRGSSTVPRKSSLPPPKKKRQNCLQTNEHFDSNGEANGRKTPVLEKHQGNDNISCPVRSDAVS